MNQTFIPGIYNYCDRWCERCTFTSRCQNYEGTSKLTSDQLDINNKAFWENIASNFTDAIQLLNKTAEKHGFDLTTPLTEKEQEDFWEKESLLKTAAKQYALSKLCKQYQRTVMPFIKKSEEFTDKARELTTQLHLGINTEEEVVHTIAGIGDCYDIIQWYLFFIDAKLQRAMRGKMENEDWETENRFPKDSDGSAKIAAIAIEKSMGAWSRLYNLLPASEDAILKALSLLAQLKRKTSEEFPGAINFKRPGFDDFD
jgi:hypothetical protein